MTTTEVAIRNNSIAIKREEMNLFMDMAKQFAKAGAFPSKSPEQLFVLMKAGQEMGMSEIESLNSLYVVNGKIEPYGKAMVAKITEDGWKLSYEDETDSEVTVVATKGKEIIRETVKDQDQIIKNSRAKNFSKKNKMRYHGVRMILNFHLPHLIRSIPDLYDRDAQDFNSPQEVTYEEVKPEMSEDEAAILIADCNTIDHLRSLHEKILDEFTLSAAIDKMFSDRMTELKKAESDRKTDKIKKEPVEPENKKRKEPKPYPVAEPPAMQFDEVPFEDPDMVEEQEPDNEVDEDHFQDPEPTKVSRSSKDPIAQRINEIESREDLIKYYQQLKADKQIDETAYRTIFQNRLKQIESA